MDKVQKPINSEWNTGLVSNKERLCGSWAVIGWRKKQDGNQQGACMKLVSPNAITWITY
jgi:hypothetical protein